MAKINRGRFTISTNVIMTGGLITRALSFGFIMMTIYIKYGGDILDKNVIKVVDMEKIAGKMPLGTSVKSLVFSLIGIFPLELITGIFGMWGAIGKKRVLLSISVLMSSFLIVIYSIFLVLITVIYDEKSDLHETLHTYTRAYQDGFYYYNSYYGYVFYISEEYYYLVFPAFLSALGCSNTYHGKFHCWEVYIEQLRGYLRTYIGLITTCIVCQVVSIVAAEYTYRKFECKEKHLKISGMKRYLLLSLQYGILRNILLFVKKSWGQSKMVFFSSVLKISSLLSGLGLLTLGLILTGDKFLTDGSLIFIFKKLYFYQYNLYNILIGVAASSVVIGTLTSLLSIANIVGTRMKSTRLLMMSWIVSFILHVPRIFTIVFFATMMEKINDHLRFLLKVQQGGYYFQYFHTWHARVNEITEHWNYMMLELNCCGVYSASDTYNHAYGRNFCCENARVGRIDPDYGSESHWNVLSYFGGCGKYKSDTCSGKILFKCSMFVGWFIVIILIQMLIEICGVIFINKEYALLKSDGIDNERDESKLPKLCRRFPIILRDAWIGLGGFFQDNWKRSKMSVLHFASLGTILVMNISLIALAINIRYDLLFGNIDINDLLARIHVLGISISRAIYNFSTVVTCFSVCSIASIVFSIVIAAVYRTKKSLIVNQVLWVALWIACITETGLWGKYIANMDPAVTDDFDSVMRDYRYSYSSARHDLSLQFNTLFVKGKCCGISTNYTNTTYESSFISTLWYTYERKNWQSVPIQCCEVETEIYPYKNRESVQCEDEKAFHKTGCDNIITTKFISYSIPFFVFIGIALVAKTICIIITSVDIVRIYNEEKTDMLHVTSSKQASFDNFDEGTSQSVIVEPEQKVEPTKLKEKKKHKEKGKATKTAKHLKPSKETTRTLVQRTSADVEIEDL